MSRAFRIGIFIVFALICLSTGIFLIGNKEFLFSKTFRLNTTFQSVDGLNNGAEVRVSGIHQGTISRIDLPAEPGAKVTLEMKLHSSAQNIIRKDSVVSIKTEGLLGNKYLEISSGTPRAPAVQNGDAIAGEVPTDFAAQAKDLAASAKSGVEAFSDDMKALQHNFLLSGFFKRRGYNDPNELTKDSISKVPARTRTREFDYDAGKLFAKPDNAELKNKKALDEAGRFLQENPFGLTVVAASLATGSSDKDRTLSKARAKVVREYLVQNFKIDDTRVKIIGLGKSKQSDDTARVQILVYAAK